MDLTASSSNNTRSSKSKTGDISSASSEHSVRYSQSNTDDKSSTPSTTSGESSEGYSSTYSTKDSRNLNQNENGGTLQASPVVLKSSVNSNDACSTEKQNLSTPCVSQSGCGSKSSGSVETAWSKVEGHSSILSYVDEKLEEPAKQEELSQSLTSLVHEIEVLLGLENEQEEVTSGLVSVHPVIPSKDEEELIVTGLLDGMTNNCHPSQLSVYLMMKRHLKVRC